MIWQSAVAKQMLDAHCMVRRQIENIDGALVRK